MEINHLELVWPGKYDEKGQLCPVERTILPFQVVETVNESKADREKYPLLSSLAPVDRPWRNMLIWGDNKVVMSSLLPRFAGKINLIFDPPFATGQDFSFRVRVGDQEFVKEPSIIEEKAYRDTWGRGLDSYLQMMYERLVLMRELLAEDGSIYVHIGPGISCYVKVVCDEIFGADHLMNELVWKRQTTHHDAHRFGNIHENILFYSKGTEFRWNPQRVSHSERYEKSHWGQRDPSGRRFMLQDASAAGSGPPRRFEDKLLHPPPDRHWRWTQDKIDELMKKRGASSLQSQISLGTKFTRMKWKERP